MLKSVHFYEYLLLTESTESMKYLFFGGVKNGYSCKVT